MATQPAPVRRWTYEEFRALPDDGNRYEVIAGDLYMTPAPRPVHQRVAFQLGYLIETYIQEHDLGGWVIPGPVDVLLAEGDYLEPDLVYVREDRLDTVTKRGVEGAPDLVVEVLSESTAARDRGIKRQRYAWFGVPEYWVVDVDARQVEVYRLGEDPVRPRIERETLKWQPAADGPMVEISVQKLMADLARIK
ncbi:MAG TPA: Uma2 family endonuclease [Longimicrobium sp.]|nr:Uma2 family endonuclease [Longimicrobium sp.]